MAQSWLDRVAVPAYLFRWRMGESMTYRLNKIDSLFPTPLLHFTVDDHEALNAALLAEIAARRAAEEGVTRTNRLGWHSKPDLFARTEPAQARLTETIKQAAAEATRKMAPGAPLDRLQLLCDGWININPTGGYNAPHDHAGAFWSGTYYVAVPDDDGDSGAIEFIAPQHLHSPGGVVKAPMTAGKLAFRPGAGTLLLFPATLTHWVHPNASAEDRVSIAFNASLRPLARQ